MVGGEKRQTVAWKLSRLWEVSVIKDFIENPLKSVSNRYRPTRYLGAVNTRPPSLALPSLLPCLFTDPSHFLFRSHDGIPRTRKLGILNVSTFKPGVGQNTALRALLTALNSVFHKSAFVAHSSAFFFFLLLTHKMTCNMSGASNSYLLTNCKCARPRYWDTWEPCNLRNYPQKKRTLNADPGPVLDDLKATPMGTRNTNWFCL